MKTTTTIVRVLLGLIFVYASVTFFLKLSPEPISNDAFKAFQAGLLASTYLIPLAKAVELLCGLAFISGKYVALANIIILPIAINIFLIHLFISPEQLPIAIFIILANVFLIYAYWNRYRGLVTP